MNLVDQILNLPEEILYLDYLKSNYLQDARNLLGVLFELDNYRTLESIEEGEKLKNKLIDSKKELINSLNDFIKYIDELDKKLKEEDMGMW